MEEETSMTHTTKLAAMAVALAGLASGVQTTETKSTETSGNDGLSGSPAQFADMEHPCINQASHLTGVPTTAILIQDRIRTGGGPLLTLTAAGTKYSCRRESDGRVTVFSEFAD